MDFISPYDLEQERVAVHGGEAEAEAVAHLIAQLPPEDAA